MATRHGPHPDAAPFLSQADETEEEVAEGGSQVGGGQPEVGVQAVTGISYPRSVMIVVVLCYINLLNYMDRFTVAGILPDIESFFHIGDSSSGLLQTVFISSYMVLAPIFGYLGDRYHRKHLLCLGIAFWSAVTLGSSFIPQERFWLLLVTRGLVGVGEASYSTIAPTIIADLFVSDQRSRMLAFFYFAIPVGSGLGYIVGSKVKDLAEDWHWALRPPRGAVERHSDSPLRYTSWAADVRALSRNRSFVLSSLGFTAVAFVTGSLALWAPAFLYRSCLATGQCRPCPDGDTCSSQQSLIFGLITCVTGFLGVGAGVEISKRLRRTNPRADPLVCAAGLLGSAPFLFLALVCAQGSSVATYGDRKRAELSTQGLLPEEAEPEERIVVPKRGRSTKVPVSSVLI
ncbi:multidrug ABC transporter ATPase [Platysternon megacephalum]|uniref:Protein spinster homolog 1 n=1 Tax=Platysternon megacephalum TaxID=55544 RepID=A0A4D9DG50_9SAUR|nr:multidrug ABC transporter ATPase [Platysternon megacephalum]